MPYIDQSAVQRTIDKISNNLDVNNHDDMIPMISTDLGNLLLACPDTYIEFMIEGFGCKDFTVKEISPHRLVSRVLLEETPMMCDNSDEPDKECIRYYQYKGGIIDDCNGHPREKLELDECVKIMNKLYCQNRQLKKENGELAFKLKQEEREDV